MNGRKDVDWETIQLSYRCRTMGNRLLADMHGVPEGAIRARAKREGWQRDLAAACRAAVRRELAVPSDVDLHGNFDGNVARETTC
jgi:hypothetical protein